MCTQATHGTTAKEVFQGAGAPNTLQNCGRSRHNLALQKSAFSQYLYKIDLNAEPTGTGRA